MTTQTLHAMEGMLHAQELLMLSLIRALPQDMRGKVADEFQAQVERSALPRIGSPGEQDTLEAFKAHIRKLSILLASVS